jgi:hypothetical protein
MAVFAPPNAQGASPNRRRAVDADACRRRGLGGFRAIVFAVPVVVAFWAVLAVLVVIL